MLQYFSNCMETEAMWHMKAVLCDQMCTEHITIYLNFNFSPDFLSFCTKYWMELRIPDLSILITDTPNEWIFWELLRLVKTFIHKFSVPIGHKLIDLHVTIYILMEGQSMCLTKWSNYTYHIYHCKDLSHEMNMWKCKNSLKCHYFRLVRTCKLVRN